MFHTKRCFGKLNKRQLEDIGTLRSPTKPIYLAKQKVENLTCRKEELEKLHSNVDIIEKEINKTINELKEEEEIFKVLEEIQRVENGLEIEKEKVNIHIKAKEELEKNKKELQERLEDIKEVKQRPKTFSLL